ncbi:phosphoglycerate mutase family protein [Leptotrichia sp. oral taxon 215 str. W9775]|jgi:2,3-bisphosphoglycerate-dependent phosphoglycerate mutase|uniref:histidine phosphatase family protein n=1 Tax=Leptotrichia sp. oral taxon 215 TaxID=712359 RepID=UPI0003AD8B6C|nr:histidine phosphatase family protein [Leptotrichia sp. oral taxon 215]ERK67862.1 phosphoglycerate mutase family protein [Leptotrichia sp. oral taxon 215 str. W9775]
MNGNCNNKNDKVLKLYIVRHGETEWNVIKRFQGQLNTPLTEKGMEKLRKTGKKLENVLFDEVYTSELGRTVASAEIILNENRGYKNKKRELQKLAELNEVYFGVWQGLTYEEVFLKYPEEGNNYFYNVKNYKAENVEAEKLEDALERFLKGINKILDSHESGNILVVTHGTVFEMFMNYVANDSIFDIDERTLMGNGDYKVFSYKDGKFQEEMDK